MKGVPPFGLFRARLTLCLDRRSDLIRLRKRSAEGVTQLVQFRNENEHRVF
jgi:hypothetical protein